MTAGRSRAASTQTVLTRYTPKIRDIHKKEFPDWSIQQLLFNLRRRYPEVTYEWVEISDEGLVAKLEEYAAYWHAKFKPKTISEEDTCTENH